MKFKGINLSPEALLLRASADETREMIYKLLKKEQTPHIKRLLAEACRIVGRIESLIIENSCEKSREADLRTVP